MQAIIGTLKNPFNLTPNSQVALRGVGDFLPASGFPRALGASLSGRRYACRDPRGRWVRNEGPMWVVEGFARSLGP